MLGLILSQGLPALLAEHYPAFKTSTDSLLLVCLALSVGMFTRGEVGAGVIFITLGYNLGGPVLIISVLTLVLNLLLTLFFILWVKGLARGCA